MQLTPNFTDTEFECACCGELLDGLPFRRFISKLQRARLFANAPFVITSGYRCPKHNAAVGGKMNSSHLKGLAADIRVQSSGNRFTVIEGLIKAGFERIGIGREFVHVDMDGSKPQRLIWVY